MARFDVYRLAGNRARLVLDVQADLLSDLKSRVVVPLLPAADTKIVAAERLMPVIEIEDARYLLMTTDIGTLRTGDLGAFVVNVEAAYRQTIIAALDFLFQGF